MSWRVVHEVGERRAQAFVPEVVAALPDGARLADARTRADYLVRRGRVGPVRRTLRLLRGRPATGRSLWHLLRDLETADEPAPRPVWLAEGPGGRWLLLAQVSPAARTLRDFLRDEFRGGLPGPRERRRLFDAIAARLRAVADRGWRLDALRADELLVDGWAGAFDVALAGPANTHHRAAGAADRPIPPAPLLRLARAFGDRATTPELMRLLDACDATPAARRLIRTRRP